METLAITQSDGKVAIMRIINPTRTFAEEVAEYLAHRPGVTAMWRSINPADVPQDREFRDALEDTGSSLDFNLSKAREIQRGRMVQAKRDLGAELAAREAAGEDVTAEKAQLQGIDPDALVDTSVDIDALKRSMPDLLKGRG